MRVIRRGRWRGMLAVLLGGACISAASAQPAPVMVGEVLASGHTSLGRHIEHLEDPQQALGIDSVRAPGARFAAVGVEQPNFGYSRSAHWLRFTLAPAPAPADLLLEVGLPSLDSVQLYSPEGAAYSVQSTGDQMPWDARGVHHRNHVFRLHSGAGAPAVFYLRVQSASVVTVPLTLWSPAAFTEHERQAQLIYGLFYGLIIAMFAYNLALLIALRDRTYLYYVAYVASFGLALFTFDGFAFEYLWPGNVWWANHALAAFYSSAILFACLFARHFLSTAVHDPRFDRLILAVAAMGGILTFCGAIGTPFSYSQLMQAVSVVGAAGAALSLITACRGLVRGYRPARFFLLAWSALLVFIVFGALRNFAILPSNFWTMNGLHVGFAFDVLLLSFGLGDRISLLRRDKLKAQAALLDHAQRHERELATRVEARTAELEYANRQLRTEAQERDALLEKLGESETRMRHLAQHDVLTGLPNRLSLHERFTLGAEYAKRNRHKLAVMLIDLDRFKELNDTRGHAAGDEALVALGARLRTTVRGSDTVARLGGDEFVVLAADLDEREAVRPVIDKISDVIGIPVSAGSGAWTLSASIGVAFFPDDGATLDDLLKLADSAMYSDKAQRKRRGVHVPVRP